MDYLLSGKSDRLEQASSQTSVIHPRALARADAVMWGSNCLQSVCKSDAPEQHDESVSPK